MFIPNNYVLVEPDEELTSNGFSFDNTFDPGKFVSVAGRVIQLPDRLLYYGAEIYKIMKNNRKLSTSMTHLLQTMHNFSLEYDTPMELQVGDRVIFRYMENMTTDDDYMLNPIVYGKGILMRYDALYARIRGEEIHPLNGLVFIDPDEVPYPIGDEKKAPAESMTGVVKYCGSPVMYKDDPRQQQYNGFEVGERVVYQKKGAVPLEYNLFEHNADGLWRVHQNVVLGVCYKSTV